MRTAAGDYELYSDEVIVSCDHKNMVTLYKGNRGWYVSEYSWSISADDWREESVTKLTGDEAYRIFSNVEGMNYYRRCLVLWTMRSDKE
jgi:hypothetical protein